MEAVKLPLVDVVLTHNHCFFNGMARTGDFCNWSDPGTDRVHPRSSRKLFEAEGEELPALDQLITAFLRPYFKGVECGQQSLQRPSCNCHRPEYFLEARDAEGKLNATYEEPKPRKLLEQAPKASAKLY